MIRVLSILGAVAFSASSALAQTTAIDDVRANSTTHVGPLYFTPSIALRQFGIDSNVFNQAENPQSDFTFTLGPKADLAIPVSHRFLLQSGVGADLVYFQKYSSERSINPWVTPRAEFFLNKISVFADGSYLRTRERPSYEIDVRSLRTERSLGGGVAYHYSPKLSFILRAGQADVKYDADEEYNSIRLQKTLNRDSVLFNASARYRITALTTIVLRADTTRDRFPFSPERNADTLRVTPGVEFNARALISGSAYAGVRSFHTISDRLEDFKGLVGSASLAYTLFGRTTFIGTADRDVTYSYEVLQPYYLVNSYGLRVRHRLAGKFDVTAAAARYGYTYRDFVETATGTPSPLPARVETTNNYSASLGYTLGPDMRIGFGLSYWERDSNYVAAYRNYDALRIGVSLSYGF